LSSADEKAAEEVYKKLVKKFGAYPESWLKFAEFYLKKDNLKAARELLPRSLKSLDKTHRKSPHFRDVIEADE
jgi:rRNA biogenesis protein RRP5